MRRRLSPGWALTTARGPHHQQAPLARGASDMPELGRARAAPGRETGPASGPLSGRPCVPPATPPPSGPPDSMKAPGLARQGRVAPQGRRAADLWPLSKTRGPLSVWAPYCSGPQGGEGTLLGVPGTARGGAMPDKATGGASISPGPPLQYSARHSIPVLHVSSTPRRSGHHDNPHPRRPGQRPSPKPSSSRSMGLGRPSLLPLALPLLLHPVPLGAPLPLGGPSEALESPAARAGCCAAGLAVPGALARGRLWRFLTRPGRPGVLSGSTTVSGVRGGLGGRLGKHACHFCHVMVATMPQLLPLAWPQHRRRPRWPGCGGRGGRGGLASASAAWRAAAAGSA